MPTLVVTFVRLVLGAAALVFGLDGVNLFTAATLIVFSLIAAGLEPWVAGRDGTASGRTSPAGPMLEVIADYLTLIIAPWLLTQALLVGSRSPLQELLLDLPLVTGAVWCARRGEKGLPAVVFAFASVIGVFLRLPALVSITRLTAVVPPVIALIGILMVTPIRYPGISRRGVLIAALVVIAAMPFVATEVLAGLMTIVGVLYVVFGPFLGRA